MMLGQGQSGVGAAGDHVHDRLGLHQVDASVQEGALGKLARLGQAGTFGDHQGEYARDHQGAAVALNLQNVFSGVRIGSLHEHQHRFIKQIAGSRMHDATIRKTVAFKATVRFSLEDVAGNGQGCGTADPDDADSALPHRRADCGNCVAKVHMLYLP